MIKTFTQDDVIRYVYHETNELETREIEKTLLCDDKLQDVYKQIICVVNQLDRNMKMPSQTVVNNIFNYAKNT